MTATLIVIPARYHSSRFPGKPLTKIAGISMLQRVYTTATEAANLLNKKHPEHQVSVIIATEDQRIVDHAQTFNATALITPESCQSGTDRAFAICESLPNPPQWVINFQGDSPLTLPELIIRLAESLYEHPLWPVVTPVMNLSWQQLDALRTQKITTPFSGTTAIINSDQRALWFSKNILPAIRNEASRREQSEFSPVHLHVGLYGYQYDALATFVGLPMGHYENIEGLEQLRLLEHNLPIYCVQLPPETSQLMIGVDTPEDAERVTQVLFARDPIPK